MNHHVLKRLRAAVQRCMRNPPRHYIYNSAFGLKPNPIPDPPRKLTAALKAAPVVLGAVFVIVHGGGGDSGEAILPPYLQRLIYFPGLERKTDAVAVGRGKRD
ncbi:hypothetical protein B0T19DRAFT_439464 [Cercophora scortea]|uniref:Uncharacterized protein n=1 Tax=Cercophora scortea TaxID=314031 RepID=A0AAE0MIT9_9PEZI|nr:hypothetical protein B0T19DRAFT_439464 [Cercophora scortea]